VTTEILPILATLYFKFTTPHYKGIILTEESPCCVLCTGFLGQGIGSESVCIHIAGSNYASSGSRNRDSSAIYSSLSSKTELIKKGRENYWFILIRRYSISKNTCLDEYEKVNTLENLLSYRYYTVMLFDRSWLLGITLPPAEQSSSK
jgi:hypothetical protein